MQPDALREHIERVIPVWCVENGFGQDPVTVATFTELAVRLLAALPDGLAQEEDIPSARPGPYLSDPDLLMNTAATGFDTKSLPSPYIRETHLEPQINWLPGVTDSVQSLTPQTATMAYGRRSSSELFPDTSGHWRTLLRDDEWWAVGHHRMYPAKDEDDARRLCKELGSRN
jgi:hypothetical protein